MPTEYAETFFRHTLTPGFKFLAYLYVQPPIFGRISRFLRGTPIRPLTRALPLTVVLFVNSRNTCNCCQLSQLPLAGILFSPMFVGLSVSRISQKVVGQFSLSLANYA